MTESKFQLIESLANHVRFSSYNNEVFIIELQYTIRFANLSIYIIVNNLFPNTYILLLIFPRQRLMRNSVLLLILHSDKDLLSSASLGAGLLCDHLILVPNKIKSNMELRNQKLQSNIVLSKDHNRIELKVICIAAKNNQIEMIV